jgi:hypothetical protein
MRLSPLAGICLLGVLSAGCGDFASTTGDNGLLNFTLIVDYELDESDLRNVVIVTGHEQRIDVDLTHEGAKQIEDPDSLTYTIGNGSVSEQFGSDSDPPDALITVDDPGAFRLDAIDDQGEMVDGVELDFDATDTIELSVRVREPWDSDFNEQPTGQPSTVVEGSHATFLPIPLSASGDRLAGDIEAQATVDPEWAAVPGASIGGVYEDGYWTINGEIDFYFIEPGDVTVTITDTVSEGSGEHVFTVEPVQMP